MSTAKIQPKVAMPSYNATSHREGLVAEGSGAVSQGTIAEPLRVLMVTSSYPTPETPRATPFIKRQVESLRSAGCRVEVFHFRGAKNPLMYLLARRRLQRQIASGGFDLVHAQFGQSGLLALPKRLPLVVTMRGSDLLGVVHDATGRYTMHGRVLQRACRMVARRADAVILVADHMQSQMDKAIPYEVIPSGIDFEVFRCIDKHEARHQLGLPPDKPLVLFVGDPHRARKRISLAEAAMRELKRTVDAELVIAWRRSAEEIPIFMNACDALIFTSMQEGSPNVVKESLACNLPVVSVKVGDVEERLSGVEGSELCTDDPQELAAALARVLASDERPNSRATVEHLDERLLSQRVMGVYRRAIVADDQRNKLNDHE